MNLKLLALLTTIVVTALFILSFFLKIPIAYVPENATYLEFVIYHIAFVIIEVVVTVSLFMHMIKTADIDSSDINRLLNLKQ